MRDKQATLGTAVEVRGIGLHSGRETRLRIEPAPANHGIVFERQGVGIPADIAHKADLPRRTAIARDGVAVHTIEHLMAGLYAGAIDNALVHLDDVELPGLDGSGLRYWERIQQAGRTELESPARHLSLERPVAVSEGDATAVAIPADELRITYTLRYPHPRVPVQLFEGRVEAESFAAEIAPARTFCLREEVEALRAAGLGQGANLENTLVIGADGFPIENELHFPDEYVRHKVLDLIGDLALLGRRLRAHVLCVRSGHSLNAALVARLLEEGITNEPGPEAEGGSA